MLAPETALPAAVAIAAAECAPSRVTTLMSATTSPQLSWPLSAVGVVVCAKAGAARTTARPAAAARRVISDMGAVFRVLRLRTCGRGGQP